MNFQLTPDQNTAYLQFVDFLNKPDEQVFVIEGYAGTGKSTLVQHLLDELPAILKACKLLFPHYPDYEVVLTATTNKAVDSLQRMTTDTVKTIQSHLGLRVHTDFKTGKTKLVGTSGFSKPYMQLIFVDEASYIDPELLQNLFTRTEHCKFVLLGDPAQVTAVGLNYAPAFEAKFPTAKLTEVVRNQGRVLELATLFRNTVNSGQFFEFEPDGNEIIWLEQDDFNQAIVAEFSRPDWKMDDSRVLAWRNQRVIEYNHFIRDITQGDPDFQPGDIATVNNYVMHSSGKGAFKTDQTVEIKAIEDNVVELGVPGKYFTLAGSDLKWFKPDTLRSWLDALKAWRANDELGNVAKAEHWIDLRATYAQTVNKSQGCTYNKVFVDVGDIGRCNSGNQIARMLYVATSRARNQVIFTGDFG